jgi:glycerate kinase
MCVALSPRSRSVASAPSEALERAIQEFRKFLESLTVRPGKAGASKGLAFNLVRFLKKSILPGARVARAREELTESLRE